MTDFKKLAHDLANTASETRGKAIQQTKKLLQDTEFSYFDYLKISKALFYSEFYLGVWMADGVEYQEALSEDIASWVDNVKNKWAWLQSFLETMRVNWDGIDKFRIDKYMYLARLLLREAFKHALEDPTQWSQILTQCLERSQAKGLAMSFHLADIYLEEMPDCQNEQKIQLCQPFLDLFTATRLNHVVNRVFEKVLCKLSPTESFEKYLFEKASSK